MGAEGAETAVVVAAPAPAPAGALRAPDADSAALLEAFRRDVIGLLRRPTVLAELERDLLGGPAVRRMLLSTLVEFLKRDAKEGAPAGVFNVQINVPRPG